MDINESYRVAQDEYLQIKSDSSLHKMYTIIDQLVQKKLYYLPSVDAECLTAKLIENYIVDKQRYIHNINSYVEKSLQRQHQQELGTQSYIYTDVEDTATDSTELQQQLLKYIDKKIANSPTKVQPMLRTLLDKYLNTGKTYKNYDHEYGRDKVTMRYYLQILESISKGDFL